MDARSEKSLAGVHPDLAAVMRRAAQLAPGKFTIIEGMRDAKRQAALRKAGASWVKVSRHQSGHAVDVVALVGGEVDWKSISTFKAVNDAVQKAAKEYGIPIIWGGNWKKRDYGHFELPKKQYPSTAPHVAKAGLPKPVVVPLPVPKPEPVYGVAEVRSVQKMLLGHGYVEVGGTDGLMGDRTRTAIMAFRSKNGLPAGDHIDDALIEQLKRPDAVRPVIAPERQAATLDDLQAKGSVIADASKKGSLAGKIATIGPPAAIVVEEVADRAGLLYSISGAMEPIKEFGAAYGVWILLTVIVLMGGFFWYHSSRSGAARLKDHVTGNTSIIGLTPDE